MDQNEFFEDAITWDLKTSAGRDYAIMFIAEVGCTVVGIDDPTLYDAAGVQLRESERCAMTCRLLRGSYTDQINAGHDMSDDLKATYDYLLQVYEDRYFAARKYEDRKAREANEKIRDVISAMFDRQRSTIH